MIKNNRKKKAQARWLDLVGLTHLGLKTLRHMSLLAQAQMYRLYRLYLLRHVDMSSTPNSFEK